MGINASAVRDIEVYSCPRCAGRPEAEPLWRFDQPGLRLENMQRTRPEQLGALESLVIVGG